MKKIEKKCFECIIGQQCRNQIKLFAEQEYSEACLQILKKLDAQTGDADLAEIAQCFNDNVNNVNEDQKKKIFELSSFAMQMSVFFKKFKESVDKSEEVKLVLIKNFFDFILTERNAHIIMVTTFSNFDAYAQLAIGVFNNLPMASKKYCTSDDIFKIIQDLNYFSVFHVFMRELEAFAETEDDFSESTDKVKIAVAKIFGDFVDEVIMSKRIFMVLRNLLKATPSLRPFVVAELKKRSQESAKCEMAYDYLYKFYCQRMYKVQFTGIMIEFGDLANALPITRKVAVSLFMKVLENSDLGESGRLLQDMLRGQRSTAPMVISQLKKRSKPGLFKANFYATLYRLAIRYNNSIIVGEYAQKKIKELLVEANGHPSMQQLQEFVDYSPEYAFRLASFLKNQGDRDLEIVVMNYLSEKAKVSDGYRNILKTLEKEEDRNARMSGLVNDFIDGIVAPMFVNSLSEVDVVPIDDEDEETKVPDINDDDLDENDPDNGYVN